VQAAAHNVDSLSKRLLLAGFVGLGFTGEEASLISLHVCCLLIFQT
jgi:hypothetical protein